jgi:hypothetical protein
MFTESEYFLPIEHPICIINNVFFSGITERREKEKQEKKNGCKDPRCHRYENLLFTFSEIFVFSKRKKMSFRGTAEIE